MALLKNASLIASTLIALQSQAASVWKVSTDSNQLFIGGTMHVLTAEDYPLPKEYAQAYSAADKLVFETDMSVVNSPEFGNMIMSQMTYQDGTTIDKVLKPDTYNALQQHLSLRGIPIQNFATFKPSLLAITLSMIELKMLGLTSEGVDLYYSKMASEHKKEQLWLETPEQQIQFLMSMGQNDENAMIDYTLKDIKKMPTMIETLRKTWREGDMQAMANVSIKEFRADYPEIYQDLLVKRNNNWLPQIVQMLNTPATELILVGALHLAGPDSVLEKLKAKGYKIEKL
ncbi:TraB/GumN family protein [Paraglaciecola aquimarina]|uniref:TraB/GumN family protein n=1 Tax=Paraglaciecola aquimarina TaxID=1235557 RepID=A0ABU3SWP4_9ALTE|nr:TraB/GumN family protein [Paraglaciecola aquimarina]MDU0354442.1 TraB/GumN family protein [Paraglaciecola aquimarina]